MVVGLVKLRLKPPVSVTVDFLKWNEGARVIAETAKYSAIRAAFTDHAMLVHKQVNNLINPEETGEGVPRRRADKHLGHWGALHRAHNDRSGKSLIITGSSPHVDLEAGVSSRTYRRADCLRLRGILAGMG